MQLVTYAIKPKTDDAPDYQLVNVMVNDPLDIMLSDSEHWHYIINVMELTEGQAAILRGGITEP